MGTFCADSWCYNFGMSDNYQAVLLEYIKSQNDSMLEILQTLVPLPTKVEAIDLRLQSVEQDVKIIKSVVKAQQKDLIEVRLLNGLPAHGL